MEGQMNELMKVQKVAHEDNRVRITDKVLVELAYERSDLSAKIKNLEAAIKANPEAVSDHHKDLWKIQLVHMHDYYTVLGERIKDLIDNG